METIYGVIASVMTIYFIIAILMFYYWLMFRKTSLKKALIHLSISVALLSALTAAWMVQGYSMQAEQAAERAAAMPKPIEIAPELLELLAHSEPESATQEQVTAIAALASQRLGDAGTQHAEALKKYFVYYHTTLAKKKQPKAVASTNFAAERRNAERYP
mgnify:CR=1 FL=1